MASLKGQKALAPQPMRVDGTSVDIVDKAVFGLPATVPGALGTPAATDTIDFRIPAGAQVTALGFQLDDMDTGALFVFGVGYRAVDPASTLVASSTYFAAAGQTVGQTGGRLTCAFKPITFQEDVYAQMVVGTAPAGIAANPEVFMIASCNQNGPR